jgi:formate-dependent nitrite reductase membrane component NrfD
MRMEVALLLLLLLLFLLLSFKSVIERRIRGVGVIGKWR